jgi:hypothetical protein
VHKTLYMEHESSQGARSGKSLDLFGHGYGYGWAYLTYSDAVDPLLTSPSNGVTEYVCSTLH